MVINWDDDDDAMLALEQIVIEMQQCNTHNPHPTRSGREVMADYRTIVDAIGIDRAGRLFDMINRRRAIAMGLDPVALNAMVETTVKEIFGDDCDGRGEQS